MTTEGQSKFKLLGTMMSIQSGSAKVTPIQKKEAGSKNIIEVQSKT